MYQSTTILKPLLTPTDFWSPEVYAREQTHVFGESWHLVGTTESLEKSGNFLTTEIAGVPVLVRNFEGSLVALRNVCVHRQCRLASAAKGHSERLKCPYHGWEFGADGRTRKIPAAMNFPHFDRDNYALEQFAIDTCGQLVFVRLSPQGLSLQEWFGGFYDKFADWFAREKWRVALNRKISYSANWKIAIEISLESYHIPEVHPTTFAEDPGEPHSEHAFFERGSSFFTQFLEPRWIDRMLKKTEQWMLKRLGVEFTGRYEHHHIFPNLLISHTDSLTLAQVIIPNGPASSTALAIQVGRRPTRPGFISDALSWGWSRFTSALTVRILNEDRAIYPEVQAGVQGGTRCGVLGRCEERLHAFQTHVRNRLDTDQPCSISKCEGHCETIGVPVEQGGPA